MSNRPQPFVNGLRAIRQSARVAATESENAQKSVMVFLELPFLDRWTWLLFGHAALANRIQKQLAKKKQQQLEAQRDTPSHA